MKTIRELKNQNLKIYDIYVKTRFNRNYFPFTKNKPELHKNLARAPAVKKIRSGKLRNAYNKRI